MKNHYLIGTPGQSARMMIQTKSVERVLPQLNDGEVFVEFNGTFSPNTGWFEITSDGENYTFTPSEN